MINVASPSAYFQGLSENSLTDTEIEQKILRYMQLSKSADLTSIVIRTGISEDQAIHTLAKLVAQGKLTVASDSQRRWSAV